MKIISKSPEETENLAMDFAKKLKKGSTVGLCGELGGGKTTFVRGLFEAMGGDPNYMVSSPTFTLLQEYPTKKGPLFHVDLYRLNTYQEFEALDFEPLFEKGVALIEWADKFPELQERLDTCIFFEILGEFERKITKR